jgi:hypothetical protein
VAFGVEPKILVTQSTHLIFKQFSVSALVNLKSLAKKTTLSLAVNTTIHQSSAHSLTAFINHSRFHATAFINLFRPLIIPQE